MPQIDIFGNYGSYIKARLITSQRRHKHYFGGSSTFLIDELKGLKWSPSRFDWFDTLLMLSLRRYVKRTKWRNKFRHGDNGTVAKMNKSYSVRKLQFIRKFNNFVVFTFLSRWNNVSPLTFDRWSYSSRFTFYLAAIYNAVLTKNVVIKCCTY